MKSISSITYTIVVLVVMVLIIATVAIPVIEQVTSPVIEDKENQGFYTAAAINEDHTISLSSSTLTIDGATYTPSAGYGVFIPVLLTDHCYVVILPELTLANMLCINSDNSVSLITGMSAFSISVTAATKTVSVSDVVITGDNPDDFSFTYSSKAFIVNNSGDYIQFWTGSSEASNIFINDSSQVFSLSRNSANTALVSYQGTAKIASGGSGYSSSSITFNPTAVEGYDNLKTCAIIDTTAGDIDVTINTTDSGPRIVVAPKVIHAEVSENGVYDSLLNIIPLLLLIIPIMVVVHLFADRRA